MNYIFQINILSGFDELTPQRIWHRAPSSPCYIVSMFIFSDFCVIHSILAALMSIPVFRALTPGPLQISIGLKMLSLTGRASELGSHEISMDLCRTVTSVFSHPNKPNIAYLLTSMFFQILLADQIDFDLLYEALLWRHVIMNFSDIAHILLLSALSYNILYE